MIFITIFPIIIIFFNPLNNILKDANIAEIIRPTTKIIYKGVFPNILLNNIPIRKILGKY